MRDVLKEAVEYFKSTIIRRYEKMVEDVFEDMIKDHGPSLKNIRSSWKWSKMSGTISPLLSFKTRKVVHRPGEERVLDKEKLKMAATKYAEGVVETTLSKLTEKVGDLENAEVQRMNPTTFLIIGEKCGHKIRIEQDSIVNVSKLGKIFNQYPCRIYVNGKFVSEDDFKKLKKKFS